MYVVDCTIEKRAWYITPNGRLYCTYCHAAGMGELGKRFTLDAGQQGYNDYCDCCGRSTNDSIEVCQTTAVIEQTNAKIF